MPLSHCVKCGTDTVRTDTDPGTYSYTCATCGQVESIVVASNDSAKIATCPICGKTDIAIKFFDYIKFITNFSNLTAPFVALITGPDTATVTWRFYDGVVVVDQVGLSCSYQFSSAGPHNVHLICNLREITMLSCPACGLTDIDGIGSCATMSILDMSQNGVLVFNIVALPAMLHEIQFANCSLIVGELLNISRNCHIANFNNCSQLTGDIADFPIGLETGFFYNCVLLTGDLADLSATFVSGNFALCALLIGSDLHHMTGLTAINLSDQSANAARVDAIVDDVYAAKSTFAPGLNLNIGGNNASVSAPQQAKIDEMVLAPFNFVITS